MIPIPLIVAGSISANQAAGTYKGSSGLSGYRRPNSEALEYWTPININNIIVVGVFFAITLYHGFGDKWSVKVCCAFTDAAIVYAVITLIIFLISVHDINHIDSNE